MSKTVEFDISLINLYSLVTYRVILELSYFIFFKMAMAAILKNGYFKKIPVNFTGYMGAIFFSKGFYLTYNLRNKGRKKMVMELTKMTLLYT